MTTAAAGPFMALPGLAYIIQIAGTMVGHGVMSGDATVLGPVTFGARPRRRRACGRLSASPSAPKLSSTKIGQLLPTQHDLRPQQLWRRSAGVL